MDGWVDNTARGRVHPHGARSRRRPGARGVGRRAAVADATLIREARAARRWPATSRRPSRPASRGSPGPQMVGGLTRRVAELPGRAPAAPPRGGRHHRGRASRAPGRQAAAGARPSARPAATRSECWQLDTTGWVDLPNSCFTYSDAGRSLFGTRTVATPMVPDLYSPRPGPAASLRAAQGRAAGARRTGGCDLFHSMHDNVHGFEITYEIDLATRARSCAPSTSRRGCRTWASARSRSGKIAALVGETRRRRAAQAHPAHAGRRGRLRPALRPDRRPPEALA